MDSKQPAYHAVNWTDGMKISQSHFTAQENHLTAQLLGTVATQLHTYDYGLLPAPALGHYANDIRLQPLVGDEVEVVLTRLDALTPGGYRVTLGYDELATEMRFTVHTGAAASAGASAEDAFLVLLQIRPFEKTPVGPLDPQELPYRHPYALPALFVSLLPESQYNTSFPGAHFVLLGRLLRRNGALVVDETFTPPATSIRSHPHLMQHYQNIGVYISEMQQNAWAIIRKIQSRSQQTDLSRNIRTFCESLVQAISQFYFRYRNLTFHLPPVYCIGDIATLAGSLFNALQLVPEREREEQLKYFAEWCEIQPGQLEGLLTQTLELRYEHTRLHRQFTQLDDTLRTISTILQRLNRLEYIGIRKENIVVKEEVVQQTIKPKKGWSLLD